MAASSSASPSPASCWRGFSSAMCFPKRSGQQSRAAKTKSKKATTETITLSADVEASIFNLLLLPPICTATVYRGERPNLATLQRRVLAVLSKNRWLLGRLERDTPWSDLKLVYPSADVDSEVTLDDLQDVLLVSAEPSPLLSEAVDSRDPEQLRRAVLKLQRGLTPGWSCINTTKPLFRVEVLSAGRHDDNDDEDTFVVVVSLNHTIGDGCTFYQLYAMLDASRETISLDPTRHPGLSEALRGAMGKGEYYSWLTTWPVLAGMARSLCLPMPPAPAFAKVNLQAVEQRKAKVRRNIGQSPPQGNTRSSTHPAFISSNDVITSDLLCRSRWQFGYMSINLRSRLCCFGNGQNGEGGGHLTKHHAGNFVHRVHLHAEDFAQPETLRLALDGLPGSLEAEAQTATATTPTTTTTTTTTATATTTATTATTAKTKMKMMRSQQLAKDAAAKAEESPRRRAPSPWQSLTSLKHGLVASWANIYKDLHFKNATQLLHLPVLPHPMPGFGYFVIFRPHSDALAVSYVVRDPEAMQNLQASPLLEALTTISPSPRLDDRQAEPEPALS